MTQYDIIVIGAGASGMTAAISAARLGAHVCLLEAKSRVGKKLLATGNGRCNISNREACEKYIVEHYRCDDVTKLCALFKKCPQSSVFDFLASVGIELRNEDGRLYPRSEKAASVLDMLRFELEHLKVEVFCDCEVLEIKQQKACLAVRTAKESFFGKRIVLACGSPAAPELSGSARGADLAKALGVSVEAFRPSLAPIYVSSPFTKQLKGVRIHCAAQLVCKGKLLHVERGELQFADGKLSGIMMFQFSAKLAHMGGEKAFIRVDLMPDLSQPELEKMLASRAKRLGYLQNEAFLAALFPKPLTVVLLKRAGLEPGTLVTQSLTTTGIESLARVIKKFDFTPINSSSYSQAQTAAGGVLLSELDDNLSFIKNRNIFFCGELLNCDGDCGGFNLHFAWLSGIIAGRAAADLHTKS